MRIVSLLPSATELLFAIGAGDEVVAVTHECDFPEAARRLPAVTANLIDHSGQPPAAIDRHIRGAVHMGSSIYALNEELLASLEPDLVVTQELCEVCAVAYREVSAAVRRLPGSVEVLSLEPRSLAGILDSALTLGAATGHEPEARTVVASLGARIGTVAARPAPPRRPRTACIEWTDPIMAGGHWVPEMVRLAGGDDVLGAEGEPSRYVEWEEVRRAAPDLVVLMPCGFGLGRTLELAGEVTGRDGFAALPCAGGRVVAVDGSSYFNRPGPRIVYGLHILAAALRARPGDPLPAGAAWVPSLAPRCASS
ncbi:MAG: cobalamin-binding protein [Candidatus Dormibacteria bacterium]